MDGDISRFTPTIFAGEFSQGLTFAVVSILSSIQAVRRWTDTTCCSSCAFAALKHRFVVLHHAVRSLLKLQGRGELLGSCGTRHLAVISESKTLQTLVTHPFRKLRNGWLHLGLGDLSLDKESILDLNYLINAYTGFSTDDFADLVDRGLSEISGVLVDWARQPSANGTGQFDTLEVVTE